MTDAPEWQKICTIKSTKQDSKAKIEVRQTLDAVWFDIYGHDGEKMLGASISFEAARFMAANILSEVQPLSAAKEATEKTNKKSASTEATE